MSSILVMGNNTAEIIELICSVILLGFTLSSFLGVFIGRQRKTREEINLSERISKSAESLSIAANEISNIQKELEKRIKFVGKLKTDATDAENMIKLSADQVSAIRNALNKELRSEGKKSFWKGVAVNFTFFILGAAVTIVVSMLLTNSA